MNKTITYCSGIECPYVGICERYIGHYPVDDRVEVEFYDEAPIVWNHDGTAYCLKIRKWREQ